MSHVESATGAGGGVVGPTERTWPGRGFHPVPSHATELTATAAITTVAERHTAHQDGRRAMRRCSSGAVRGAGIRSAGASATMPLAARTSRFACTYGRNIDATC